jgi:tetratricopeptide (TPR) repeat protein
MIRLASLLPVAAALWVLPQWACAAATDWRDLESRIQYAWYTEDGRELAAVEKRVTELPAAEPLRSYYLALIQLHEWQLAQAAAHAGGAPAAAACVSSADDALAARPTDAEVLALQSLCMELRSHSRAVGLPFAASRDRAQMQRALQLDPRNPRVRLMAAQFAYVTARSTAERAQLVGPFQQAVDAFEAERQGLEHVPGWGAAEAWEGLARIHLERGDAIAARSALEHALLLMPEYSSAHRLLNQILSG